MSTIMEDLLLSEPATDRTLTVNEALLLEDLTEAETAFLLEVRDMFDGTITLNEWSEDEEGETPKTDKDMAPPEVVGDARRPGSRLSRRVGLDGKNYMLSLWEGSSGRAGGNEDVPSGGLRDRTDPEF